MCHKLSLLDQFQHHANVPGHDSQLVRVDIPGLEAVLAARLGAKRHGARGHVGVPCQLHCLHHLLAIDDRARQVEQLWAVGTKRAQVEPTERVSYLGAVLGNALVAVGRRGMS